MKLLLFSGSHSRHVFFHKALVDAFDVAGVVCMSRENVRPEPDAALTERDRSLFRRHFETRAAVEGRTYDGLDISDLTAPAPSLMVEPAELNSIEVRDFVRDSGADACVIFGTDLIFDPVLSALPAWRLNLHLGLSPWYRGSATLFWPFYFLQPQFAGATIHQIIPAPDGGQIVHHVVPELKRGLGLHDVAAEVVVRSREAMVKLLLVLERVGRLPTEEQRSSGKLFLSKDFEPQHLRLIYELYEDRIVDEWLDGRLGNRTPRLVDAFSKIPVQGPSVD